jgi:predicted ATPase
VSASGQLVGRAEELATLRTLIANAREGVAGSTLIVGEPGIGKSSLLRAALSESAPAEVLEVTGYEAESNLAFSGLQRLLRPLAGFRGRLPSHQSEALRVAAGLAEGPPPERALVGLAVLSLLAHAAESRLVVCSVDDAHLVDRESLEVLGFVARRLSAESLVFLFSSRDDATAARALAGVEVLPLGGLDTQAAMTLLTRSLPEVLEPAVAAGIAERTQGNPLALTELSQHWSAGELTTASFAHAPVPIGRQLEDH